jgi:hypothetical protein
VPQSNPFNNPLLKQNEKAPTTPVQQSEATKGVDIAADPVDKKAPLGIFSNPSATLFGT